MKLVPYDLSKLPGESFYSRSDNLRILEEFANSGLDCAKVENFTHKHASSCASSLKNSIRNYKMYSIQVITSRGEVFLIKKKVEK